MDDGAVVFSSDSEHIRFQLDSVRKAKRRKGSPVLQLDWLQSDSLRSTAFFFVQPPPLHPAEPGGRESLRDPVPRPAGLLGGSRMTKSRHRKTNLRYLQTGGISTKAAIQGWADEIGRRLR